MSLTITLQLLGGVFLLAANAFFVAIEFALTRLRQYDKEELGDDPGLQRAWKMTEELEIHLTGCQVGITTTSILLGVIAEPGVTKLIQLIIPTGIGSFSSHSISIVLSLIIINFVHTVWGEQAPTYLGVERAKQVARHFARPLHWWTVTIRPILTVGDWLTKATLKVFGITMTRSWTESEEGSGESNRAKLKNQIADLAQGKGLSEERQEEIKKSVEVGEIPVRDIMVPRDEIIYLSTKKDFIENLNIIRDSMRNRYPLVRGNIDDYAGILYAPEILARIEKLQNGEMILDDLDHYDMAVPPDLKVSDLIDRFQSNKQELALVKDEEEVVGMVTLTDAVEVIIGSAEDPMDTEEATSSDETKKNT